MNIIGVLVSAVTDGTPATLLPGTDTNPNASSGEATAATTSPLIESETVHSSKAQVLTLLDANDGRMYQQDVVAKTGFSKAKISRLLSELEDNGQIARLRKGRKKIVVNPELLPPVLTETR